MTSLQNINSRFVWMFLVDWKECVFCFTQRHTYVYIIWVLTIKFKSSIVLFFWLLDRIISERILLKPLTIITYLSNFPYISISYGFTFWSSDIRNIDLCYQQIICFWKILFLISLICSLVRSIQVFSQPIKLSVSHYSFNF